MKKLILAAALAVALVGGAFAALPATCAFAWDCDCYDCRDYWGIPWCFCLPCEVFGVK